MAIQILASLVAGQDQGFFPEMIDHEAKTVILGRFLYLGSMDAKDILHQLARYYGGEYTEVWEEEMRPGCKIFSATIRTPRAVFNYRQMKSDMDKYCTVELPNNLEEKVRYQLIWSILQKGVEYVNEQSDIFKMFNPESGHA